MGRLFAAIYDPFMRKSEEACLQEWRRDLLSPLTEGRVLEVGAGTGANLAHYPGSLEHLVVTDPDEHMLARLERGRSHHPALAAVHRASVDSLPFDDASFDAVVCTLVLCSVPNPDSALAEIRRVLRPGGAFVFLEHVAAEDAPKRLKWQRRIEPFWSRIAGNCHLSRTTEKSIEQAGFTFESLTKESMRKALPIVRPTIRGLARKA